MNLFDFYILGNKGISHRLSPYYLKSMARLIHETINYYRHNSPQYIAYAILSRVSTPNIVVLNGLLIAEITRAYAVNISLFQKLHFFILLL